MHPIRTSPYHPQTDGLVERFNQTLKSMLRKTGTDGGKEWDKKIPYLLQRLVKSFNQLVQENLSSSQRRQKSWFDKGARLREFKPGDSVLVLLPTSSNRLLAQWQGPYQVVQRMGKVNYLIDMQDKIKKEKTGVPRQYAQGLPCS